MLISNPQKQPELKPPRTSSLCMPAGVLELLRMSQHGVLCSSSRNPPLCSHSGDSGSVSGMGTLKVRRLAKIARIRCKGLDSPDWSLKQE
eukprot:1193406-Prorocentrum_minimum.AAC.2